VGGILSRGLGCNNSHWQLSGLFFSINTREIESSPFGEIKFEISAHELLNRQHHRVYFADFYCNSGLDGSGTQGYLLPHYITLVVCKKNSPSDE
jgi:Phytanoyl-CoA hydroxylase-interacting protein C-terminus